MAPRHSLEIVMQPIRYARQAGFTLVELVFVVAIVGALASFASTSVVAAVHASRSSNGLASLVAALVRARSGAASAGVEIVLCPSQDGASCASGYHWEDGWIAFATTNGKSDRQPGDPIVLRQEKLPAKVHLVSTSGRTRIHFQPSGGSVGSNVTFTFCDGRGPAKASAYVMGNNGNLHSATPGQSNIAEACSES
jgi:type IV fimbrial biogenesis protein FimT